MRENYVFKGRKKISVCLLYIGFLLKRAELLNANTNNITRII